MDKEFIDNPVEAYEELKAENERLKKELKNNKSAYEVELGTYNVECGNLLEENNQLLQTLQEIKKIAEIAFAVCDDDCGNANRFTEILDLITKAEVE